MEKIRCPVSQCLDGYIIATNIYTASGLLVVPAKTQMNEYIKQKLHFLGIKYIDIIINNQNETIKNSYIKTDKEIRQLKVDYYSKVKVIKSIFQDLAAGKKLDIQRVDDIAGSIYSDIYSNYGIVECINKVRNSDEYTYTHCLNVSIYSMFIARWMKLECEQIRDIIMAGLLHDVGKAKIPLEVLNKQGPLDRKEFEIIKQHTVYGYNLVAPFTHLKEEIKKAVLSHHEKQNGSGYPYGLCSKDIGLYAKIVAIADIYDALTSKRVYRPKLTPFDTFKEIDSIAKEADLYDLNILFTFLANISTYYIGLNVKLSDGNIGTIVYIPPQNISCPIIQVNDQYIDMKKERILKIQGII